MTARRGALHGLPSLAEDPDYPVTLAAPGRPWAPEHPALAPLPKAMDWLTLFRRHMLDNAHLPPEARLIEADRLAREGIAARNHDRKGRAWSEK